jgi:VanZ family protein
VFWWVLGGLFAAGIAVGSLIPGEYLEGISIRDKVLHALAYFLLMFWFAGLFRRGRHWIVAIAIFLFGLALDVAQAGTSSRSYDLADVAANAGGILLALALAWFLSESWCRRVEQLFIS